MSTLYIRLPSKAAADSAESGAALLCQYALASDGGKVQTKGAGTLSELSGAVQQAGTVVVLVAASDVTLLRMNLPPLSASRLKAALPNMVEDQIMSDPAECVLVPGATVDGLRTIAVIQRSWLELLANTMHALGAKRVLAVPSQLCLPLEPGAASAAVSQHDAEIDVTLRTAAQEGVGLPILAEQPETAPLEVIETLLAVVPAGRIRLFVPPARMEAFEAVLAGNPNIGERIELVADNWNYWVDAAGGALNLMSGLVGTSSQSFNWRPWRWPLALAAALLAVNAAALNIDWLRMKREADSLQARMIQTYRSAYPKETVVVDPVAQLRQKIAAGKREAGQAAPDDFLSLAAAFGEAWSAAGQGAKQVAGLEYRDRALTVKLKPGSGATLEQMRPALSARNLSATEAGSNIWQIRSGK